MYVEVYAITKERHQWHIIMWSCCNILATWELVCRVKMFGWNVVIHMSLTQYLAEKNWNVTWRLLQLSRQMQLSQRAYPRVRRLVTLSTTGIHYRRGSRELNNMCETICWWRPFCAENYTVLHTDSRLTVLSPDPRRSDRIRVWEKFYLAEFPSPNIPVCEYCPN